jgi:N-acetylneuraminate synthase
MKLWSVALDETEELELKKYVESKGLIISTPFSRSSRTVKSLTYRPIKLIGREQQPSINRTYCFFGKPVILSTGMNTIESVATNGSYF